MLSFIIPTLNEEKHIKPLLESLCPQLKGDDEIIIVDSFSKDRTVEHAKALGARVVMQQQSGIGLAKTAGAKAAKNDILVFLDADCVLAPDFAERIRKHFSDSKIKAVGGFGRYSSDSAVWGALYNIFAYGVFQSARVQHMISGKYWMAANNVAYRKDVFFSVGGFRSVICEDTDMMRRLAPSKDVRYDPKMKLTLSDRRFREKGFFRTVGLWGWSNIAASFGKGLGTDGYRE
jgi:glycosyltransferase involved in cell wall biosynthesis